MAAPRPFPFDEESSAFMKSFMEDVGIKVSEHRRIFISEQNIHRFNHGIKWQSHNSDKPDDISTMEVISNELEFEKTDISQYETQTLSRLVTVLSERISDSFARSMYATLNDSCDQAGQVVDAKGKTLAESFVEILEKISTKTLQKDLKFVKLNQNTSKSN